MFLSRWSPSHHPSPVHHGEKFRNENTLHMDVYGITNLEMEKRRLLIEELDVVANPDFICVDPYEVSPLIHRNTTKDSTMDGGTADAVPATKIKLEMEEFGDLSPFVLSKPALINFIDEFHTPIFDKDAFDFGTNSIYSNNNNNTNVNNNLITDKIYTEKEHTMVKLEHDVAGITSTKKTTTEASTSSSSSSCSSARQQQQKFTDIFTSQNSVSTTKVYAEQQQTQQSSKVTPKQERLSLNVNVKFPVQNFDLNTPTIIDEVVDLQNAAGFNIIDFVNKDEIGHWDSLDFLALSTSTDTPSKSTATKQPRKRRKLSEDDDEDYLPPSVKKRQRYVSDSDSDDEEAPKPRGRPPKRAESVSSECSDASKYRELRDKNNEASRKSRLKRKMKEMEMEKEAEELTSRNIKLKAQVEELEKLVTNFRENLFKMMMKK